MSIFPFIDYQRTEEESTESLPVLKEYAYDFLQNELLLDTEGRTYLVEGNEALCIWIHKALGTSRFHYTAYSASFGTEWKEQLLGHTLNGDVQKLEMERFIIEALMVNPYIKSLDNFLFINSLSGLNVTFDCISVYGTQRMNFEMKEVKG